MERGHPHSRILDIGAQRIIRADPGSTVYLRRTVFRAVLTLLSENLVPFLSFSFRRPNTTTKQKKKPLKTGSRHPTQSGQQEPSENEQVRGGPGSVSDHVKKPQAAVRIWPLPLTLSRRHRTGFCSVINLRWSPWMRLFTSAISIAL